MCCWMYYNDRIQGNLLSGLLLLIWFTQNIKQCFSSLSPLLFALRTALHNTKLGVPLGTEVLTVLLFADNLVLVSSTPKLGINTLMAICAEVYLEMRMKLSITKTFIVTNGKYLVSSAIEDTSLEEVLVAKYLGVSIKVRGRGMIGIYEAQMLKRAKKYAYTIL